MGSVDRCQHTAVAGFTQAAARESRVPPVGVALPRGAAAESRTAVPIAATAYNARPTASMRSTTYLLVVLVCGCKVGPEYEAPRLDLPEEFDAGRGDPGPATIDAWWQTFEDPLLTRCIEEACTGNL